MYIGGKSKIPNSLFWVLSWFADHVIMITKNAHFPVHESLASLSTIDLKL